jgi:hypothetical protein
MNNEGLIRACLDVHRIGQGQFVWRRFLVEIFFKYYRPVQKHQDQMGDNIFYVITNKKNRVWLINSTLGFDRKGQYTGGFYQVIDKTFLLPNMDYALVPSFMYPKNGDFSFLNLEMMFMWMCSYPVVISYYGFRPIFSSKPDEEYIDVKSFFSDFMTE